MDGMNVVEIFLEKGKMFCHKLEICPCDEKAVAYLEPFHAFARGEERTALHSKDLLALLSRRMSMNIGKNIVGVSAFALQSYRLLTFGVMVDGTADHLIEAIKNKADIIV